MALQRALHIADLEALTSDTIGLGGTLSFRARGYCMRPAIQDGDMVSLGPAGAEGWRLGDVVLARGQGGLCLHRIVTMGVGLNGPWVVLAADADPVSREKLPVDLVMAKMVGLHAQRRENWFRIFRVIQRRLGLPLALRHKTPQHKWP
ncbi:MAG: hypothetical protein JRF33_09700 [Deltaproteobacteria bacterium]|nr:hypothetical protein [Deltaproteobacteria bacterium]